MPKSIEIQGAVLRRDDDTRKELPIGGAQVTASDGIVSTATLSDNSGYFKIDFPGKIWPGQTIFLRFQHPEYRTLDLSFQTQLRLTTRELYVAALDPLTPQEGGVMTSAHNVVSNIRIRYTVNSRTDVNIGSATKIFQVVNTGNTPCNQQSICSPDGHWKAGRGSISLDAGADNEFRDVRASCIAGPCPFTRIDSSGFSLGGRSITASALSWSDTATFLLEAEVFHAEISSNVHELYPVVFGRTLNFTLPPTEEGVSIEAELNGAPMVFPLGPELYLSWATCTTGTNQGRGDETTVYRCELKPGYNF